VKDYFINGSSTADYVTDNDVANKSSDEVV